MLGCFAVWVFIYKIEKEFPRKRGGPDDTTWTRGHWNPNPVLYQTELRPDILNASWSNRWAKCRQSLDFGRMVLLTQSLISHFPASVVQGVGLGPTNFQIISLGPYQLGHPCINKAHNITVLYQLSYAPRFVRSDGTRTRNTRHLKLLCKLLFEPLIFIYHKSSENNS